jgi:mannose-P-dolichol utilization defect protein 1
MDVLQNSLVAPLQPLLRPIVDAIPEPVHDAVISLIGSPCHSALLLDLDLTKDPACTSLAISKALGIAIVGASAVVKVPQILKLISSRSSAGVSFVSYALETASLLITLSYGVRNQFPFSTYGESALIAIQDVAVGVLVLTFAGRSAAAATFVAVVAAAVYALLFDQTLVDAQTMSYLQAGAGILGVASKAPQIYTIWSQGGTGQLSAFAVRLRRFLPAPLQMGLRLTFFDSTIGLQLPRRFPLSHLHYSPRSRRQADPLRFHCRLHPQRDPRHPDVVLLEQPRDAAEEGYSQQDYRESSRCPEHGGIAQARLQDAHYAPTGLEGYQVGIGCAFFLKPFNTPSNASQFIQLALRARSSHPLHDLTRRM